MQNNKIGLIIIFFIITILSGCAISNEGATDFKTFSYTKNSPLRGKFVKPSSIERNGINTVKKGDPLVVKIKQVFINEFTEYPSPLRWVRWSNWYPSPEPANGEIAILVNAFERGGKQTLDHSPDGKKNARVVFFSDDVWEGQPLNLSTLSTIYGPLTYDENPFVLDLYIVELDTPGPQQKQLIANLAAIGATFYPPASPLVGPLAKLASTFIADDQDDKAYHHSLELYPLKGSDPELNTAIFQKGDYVFIRSENRLENIPWNTLDIDENNGKVIYINKEHCKAHKTKPETDKGDYPKDCYYKENTYVVIEVNTAASSLKNDTEQMVYSQLGTKLANSSSSAFKEPIDPKTLEDLSNAIAQNTFSDTINSDFQILSSANTAATKQVAAINIIDEWCEKSSEDPNKNKHTISDIDKKRFEAEFLEKLSACPSDTKTIIDNLSKFKDRKNCSNPTVKESLVTAISCLSS